MSLDDRFSGVTTIVEVSSYVGDDFGTGFFYHQVDEDEKQNHWIEIKDEWLVTNKHVIIKEHMNIPIIPQSLTFRHRKITDNASSKYEWVMFTLSKEDLINRTRVHSDSRIDIAVIRVTDLIFDIEEIRKTNNYQYINNFAVNKNQKKKNKK